MINIRSIKKLTDGDGITLKNGKPIRFKTGWQVADYGIETTCPREAITAVKAYNGNCGVWFENGIYYIPAKTIFGISTLSTIKVIEKKIYKKR